MESVKYCAYNTTKASFLNLRITVVDTLHEPFTGHMEDLARNAQAGVWLNPCREIPMGDGLPPFDIIYLDEDCRVVQVVEFSAGGPRAVPAATAASALALPSRTISASQTKCGDELMIWASYGEEKRPGRTSRAAVSARVGPVRESAIASVLTAPSGPAQSLAAKDAGLAQAALKRPDEKEKADSTREEKPTLTARFRSWTAENLTHRGGDVPLSVIPVSVAPASIAPTSVEPASVLRASIAPAPAAPAPAAPARVSSGPLSSGPVSSGPVSSAPVTPAAVAAGAASSPAKPSAALRSAVSPPAGAVSTSMQDSDWLDEEEKAEFTLEERSSFTSRLRNWNSERLVGQGAGDPATNNAAPVSRASISAASVPITSVAVEPARVMQASIASGPMTPAPLTPGLGIQASSIQAPVVSGAIRQAAVAPAADGRRAESFIAKPSPAPRSAAAYSAGGRAERSQAAPERSIEKEKPETRPLEKPAAAMPLKTRNAESKPQPSADVPLAASPAAMPAAAAARSDVSLLTNKPQAPRAAAATSANELPATPQASLERTGDKKKAAAKYQRKHSLMTRIKRWVNGTAEPAERHHLPDLVAYFWTGGAPQAHPVGNISTSGLYLHTKERWMSDTVLLMNLQSASAERGKAADSISVLSQVVRAGEDGVGVKFVTPDSLDRPAGQLLPPIQTDKETLERFLKGFKRAEQAEVK